MSDLIVLTLASPPPERLVAEVIVPDRLASLGAKEIAGLPVLARGRPTRLGDFFKVQGERAARLRLEGELAQVDGIGTAMADGELVVEGSVGRDLGVAMSGGRIEVRGGAGDNAGGARPGAARGMTGGEIVIRGSAGSELGAAARRGLIVVGGNAGPAAARGMIAGTVVVFGAVAAGAGRFLKRGSIVAMGEITWPGTFRYSCTYRPPHLALLLTYLRARYGVEVREGQANGRYERHVGDCAELGKGEILRWVGE